MAKEKSLEQDFFPPDYKLPDGSGYMKFLQGENKFRILSSPVMGYEYWTTEDKPVRSKEKFTETPNIKIDPKTGKSSVNHFWAMVVYNYATEEVQILEVTQKGILKYILGMVNDQNWGSPKGYDLVVTREGEGLATKYSTRSNPHKDVDKKVLEKFEASEIDLEELFKN